MKNNKNAIIEAIGGLKILLHDFEKKATPRVPFKAMRQALATAIKCCEKQIPKKYKTFVGESGIVRITYYECPCCGEIGIEHGQKYCHECGQKLDWGD